MNVFHKSDRERQVKQPVLFDIEQLGILTPTLEQMPGIVCTQNVHWCRWWIDKLNRIGFSLPEIKSFLSDFKSMEAAADLMEGSTLYRES